MSLSSITLANGDTMYYGRQKMIPSIGDNAVRSTSFFLPDNLQIHLDSEPVVLATVDGGNVGAGSIMHIYAVKVVLSETRTEVAISAVTQSGLPLDYDYFCNITVIGKIVK